MGRGRIGEAEPGAGPGAGPGEGPGAIRRGQIIAEARSWLGTPYLHQASAKGQGADCLGLVRGVWRALYGFEPEAPPAYGPDWNERRAGTEPLLAAARRHFAERPLAAARPGDVLVFRVVRTGPAKHCGVLADPDRFIHAYQGRAVVESWLNRWWGERLAGVFGFPGTED
jgi:NlpC/P60 family putative phage cell wall peptidase